MSPPSLPFKKIILNLIIVQFIFEPQSVFATSASSCPYNPTDYGVIDLANNTKSLLEELQSTEEECGQQFTNAIKSIAPISVQVDRSHEEEDQVRGLLEQKQALLFQASYAAENGNSADAESILYEIQELDNLINRTKKNQNYNDKKSSEEEVILATNNLINAVQSASQDSNCRKFLNKGLSSRVIELGLGALSLSGPLMYSSGYSSMTGVSARMLSDIVGMMRNFGKNRGLKQFEERQLTTNIACMYHAIMSVNCQLKFTPSNAEEKAARQFALQKQAKCIPKGELAFFTNTYNANNVVNDLQDLMVALGTSDPGITRLKDQQSDPSDILIQEINELEGKVDSSNTSTLNLYREYLKKLEYVKRKILEEDIDKQDLSLDALSKLKSLAGEFGNTDYPLAGAAQRALGIKFVYEDASGNEISEFEMFRQNYMHSEKFIKLQIEKYSGNGDLQPYMDPSLIHSRIDRKSVGPKIQYALDYLKKVKDYGATLSKEDPDWETLQIDIKKANEVLKPLAEWVAISPNQFTSEKKYKDAVTKKGSAVRAQFTKHMKSDNLSESQVNQAILELVKQPVLKVQTILTRPILKKQDASNPFADPFEKEPGLNAFSQYSALREASNLMDTLNAELSDRNEINETRGLFETSELGDRLKEGIEDLIDDISKKPDPEVAKQFATELCGLAYSLPNSRGKSKQDRHPIAACDKFTPSRMKDYLKPEGGDRSCSYVHYLRDETRKDAKELGRTPLLPTGARK